MNIALQILSIPYHKVSRERWITTTPLFINIQIFPTSEISLFRWSWTCNYCMNTTQRFWGNLSNADKPLKVPSLKTSQFCSSRHYVSGAIGFTEMYMALHEMSCNYQVLCNCLKKNKVWTLLDSVKWSFNFLNNYMDISTKHVQIFQWPIRQMQFEIGKMLKGFGLRYAMCSSTYSRFNSMKWTMSLRKWYVELVKNLNLNVPFIATDLLLWLLADGEALQMCKSSAW